MLIFPFFQNYMPRRKTGEEMNFTYVECLLYSFHHLAHKVADFLLICFVNLLAFDRCCAKLTYSTLLDRFPMLQIVYVVTK